MKRLASILLTSAFVFGGSAIAIADVGEPTPEHHCPRPGHPHCANTTTTGAPTSSITVPATTQPTTSTVAPTTQPPTTPPSTTQPPTTLPPTTTTTPSGTIPVHSIAVGGQLPSEAECAGRFVPMTENRPQNVPFNNTRGTSPNNEQARVTGNFVGTTDEIIQWAACKWGMNPDWARAQAGLESWWRQNDTYGDWGTDPAACIPGHGIGVDGRPGECPQSIGLFQVRYPFHQSAFEDNNAVNSTAYNADYSLWKWRVCFEGGYQWLNTVERGRDYAAGDGFGCLGVWYWGRWYTQEALYYMNRVQNEYFIPRIWTTSTFGAPQPR